jgi:hypothetical protein
MADIFDHTILCKKCGRAMQPVTVIRNGFKMRAMVCPQGHDKIIHPQDIEDYKKFKELKNKEFRVKMRLVGNSYAVSIPKEIVSFLQEQEKVFNDVVKLCFEESGKLSLTFNKLLGKEDEER